MCLSVRRLLVLSCTQTQIRNTTMEVTEVTVLWRKTGTWWLSNPIKFTMCRNNSCWGWPKVKWDTIANVLQPEQGEMEIQITDNARLLSYLSLSPLQGVVKYWNKLLRDVVEVPSLETFKISLDMALSNLTLSASCRRGGQDDLWASLPTKCNLWICESVRTIYAVCVWKLFIKSGFNLMPSEICCFSWYKRPWIEEQFQIDFWLFLLCNICALIITAISLLHHPHNYRSRLCVVKGISILMHSVGNARASQGESKSAAMFIYHGNKISSSVGVSSSFSA